MKIKVFSKMLAILLAVTLVITMVPFTAFAASIEFDDTGTNSDYYKLVSKRDWELAPGIVESEIVLNNADGSHRQVAHVAEVDMSNPYTKVIPSYKGMNPTPDNYGTQIMSQQAAYAEANGYGNVVAAMNLSLSWYDSAYYVAHPEFVGEPLGYMVLDGKVYKNSQGQTSGAQTCVVINFDEKDGVARPENMPKVEIRSTSSAITGWEEQVIPANFGFLVKDGVNQYKVDNNAANGASRSFVGIKADGTFVMVMNDGRQSPYSAGFTNYEMAEFMLSLGCVQAVNGDGGGSSTFLSQRPGEELKVNCSPSDGAERPTTHGILVISTAPATGEFVRANITAENDYYTPGSTVRFSALGTDLVGTAAEIPADVSWQLADPSMGTIKDGVFVSNGTVGTATAQMVYNGEVVGSDSVEIIVPTEFVFSQAVMTVPFEKEVNIGLKATINGGLNDVVLKPSDIVLTTTNDKLGTFDGFMFTSVSEANAPANLTGTLTATLVHDTTLVATASLSLGKGSEVLFDFEDASDINAWNIADVNGNDKGFYQHLSYATADNGEVHNGVGSMRVEMNPIAANAISNGGYGQSDLFLDSGVVVKNAKSIGFWAYIPDEYEHCWIRVLYWYDSNNDGVYDKKNTISVISQPEVYQTLDESGWRYFSVDVSKYSEILIPGLDCKDKIAYNGGKNDANNFRFIEFMFPHTNTNDLWKTYGTINGLQTVYIDNITADFSDAVDDREAPIFSKVELAGNDTGIALEKYNTVTTASNLLTVTASVAENTAKVNATGLNVASAKAYVDGVEVPVTFANGRMTISDVAVADGVHRVKFEIYDNAGNKSVVIRLINVASGVDASTVQLVPADPTLNNLYGGSVYWINLNANKLETIKSVKAVIDLNYGNHFELDSIVLADGFTAEYSIDEENNTATVTITRTGTNLQTGATTLAALPVRVIYYDTDINIEGYTAETYWNTYEFWPYDLKVDVDMGEITYVDDYTSNVLGVFSNEEFSVDTELQAAFSNADFKTERGTAHVHTAKTVDDKPATCTEVGYTGRTFCEVCNSVVVWGSVVAVTEHEYAINDDGKLACINGGELFNGVHTDGKTYVNGVIITDGWDDAKTSYYENGVKLVGSHFIENVMYTFDENGVYDPDFVYNGFYESENGWMYFASNMYRTGFVVIDGITHFFKSNGYAPVGSYSHDGITYYFDGEQGKIIYGEKITDAGKQLYYSHRYYKNTWVTVGVNKYYCDNNGFAQVGTCAPTLLGTYVGAYEFDENGVFIKNITGVFKDSITGNYFYAQDGVLFNGGLLKWQGNYYYARSNYQIVTGTYYVSNGNGLMPEGVYDFDADGKMIISEVTEPEVKNGVVNEDGILSYYIDDVKQYGLGLVEWEGNYYYVRSNGNVVTGTYYVSNGNGLMPEGVYDFDSDGKMIIDEVVQPEVKNGVVNEDGILYYYIEDVKQYGLGLVEWEGNYYYVRSNGVVITGTYYVSNGNGLMPEGVYDFDSDGKMIIVPEVKNGVVNEDGILYYYIEDVKQYGLGLVEWEGNYYYVRSTGVVITGTYYVSNGNGLMPEGVYDFDDEGKMIIDETTQPEIKNGVVKENGTLGYYIDNVKQYGLGLVEWEDNYYYVRSNGVVITGTYYVSNGNGLMPEGVYDFDSDGKMIISEVTEPEVKNGVVNENGTLGYYIDNVKQYGLGLVRWDNNYYYVKGNGTVVAGMEYYISNTNKLLPEGVYKFNEDGTMVVPE